MEGFQREAIKSCIKVYLCSNPEDSVEERRALREDVFPKVRDYCRRTHGLEFRVIDPYEGVNLQDVSDPRAQEVRLQLLEECWRNSAGPFFVAMHLSGFGIGVSLQALVGKQYGTACIPAQVEVSEFQQVLQTGQQMGISTQVLERWYQRDENAVPPSFCLLDHHHNDQMNEQQNSKLKMQDIQEEMRSTFHTIVIRCIEEGSLTPDKAQKYFRSALDKELHFALENRSKEDIARCLCYVHKITRRGQQREPLTDCSTDSKLDISSSYSLSTICDHFLPGLVTSSQLQVYTSTTACKLHSGYTAEMRTWYTEGLCQQLHSDLLNLISCTVARETTQLDNALAQELFQQAELCKIYSSLYRIQCEETQHIKAYLEQKDTEYPFVLTGGPCTGKTVLLAFCASQASEWLVGRDPEVVIHFINRGPSTVEQLLACICNQLALRYNQSQHHLPLDICQLKIDFRNLLITASSSPCPLVLMLDGLDQIPGIDGAQGTWWLPESLPANVKLIISTAPKKSGTLQALKALYPKSSLFFEMKMKDRRVCNKMLTDLLVSDGRKITSGQQVYVNQALKDCSLPLYVELLHRQVCTWSSRMDVSEESLIKGVHDNIRRFLAQLEQDHGKELVCKAMCYLAIAKSGITEAELTDILSCENDVLSQYLPAGGVIPYKLRVPEAAVERLLYDLRGFLMKRNISGFQVLFWPSRHFPLVIHKVFLHTTEMVREAHSALADYFNGQWAYGRTKSMLSQNNVGETEHPCSPLPVIYTDRQLPGQPWVFNSLSEDMDINVRKILELPFHLKNSGRLEELLSGVMLSPGFHQGMLKAGHLEVLVSHLKETAELMSCKELEFLSTLIRDAACLLQNSPKDLIAVMQAQLFPFLEVLPKLNSYAKHIYQEGVRTQGVNVLHSPVSAVPSTSWELPDVVSSPVMEVLETQCDAVVMILHDSTIWVWNEKVFGGYKPFHSSDFNISNMKSAGHFLLLSTNSNRLILYNLKTPSYICELDVHTIVSSAKDPDLALTIEGFMFTENRIILWYRATNFIHIFDINTGERIEQLLCPNIVTCVSFSHDHQFILCGQDKSTVSIFSVNSNSHLATCSSSMATSIMNVPICEDEHMMACVDRFGNVIVWDIKTLTNPKLREEIYNMNDQEEVLNTEHLMLSSTFLICKRHQIVLWDTHNWTVEDQFKAPCDKVFIQAVLAKDGLLIIACLEDCPFLLVWKRTSGQCVLSLDIGHSRVLRLLKMGSALLAVTLDGVITTWDVDLIWSASVISKTGLKVEKLVVDSTGQQFYTADGTEMIWKWGVLSRTAKGCFLHDGPVETFTVSKDCKHLVTASPRDIYVWQTVTGENLHRIHGSHVSSLLITPNGNFAVSLCKRGLSSVWNLESGHVVCNVHLYLSNAVISPESTFILGLHKGELLAVSLWSGFVNKTFFCSGQSEVITFQPMLNHPDYVILITVSGDLYTWKVTEETVCKHINLPGSLLVKPELFQVSSDGKFALLSTTGATITILDTLKSKLCSLQAEGQVLTVCLDVTGCYVVFICNADNPNGCNCDLHSGPVLSAARISDRKNVGKFFLCKVPCSLSLSEDLSAFVGFSDGSVGVYAISDAAESSVMVGKCLHLMGQQTPCPCEEPQRWLPLTNPSIIRMASTNEIV